MIPIDILEKMYACHEQEWDTEDFPEACFIDFPDDLFRRFGSFFNSGKECLGPDLIMQNFLEHWVGCAAGMVGTVSQD